MHVLRSHGRRLAIVALTALTAGLLCACGGHSDSSSTRVRFLNATYGLGNLNLFTGDDKRASDVTPDSVSGYSDLDAGTYTAKIKSSGSDASLATGSVSLQDGKPYTAVAWGRQDAVKLALLTDDADEPNSGLAKVRLFNATPDAGSIDMYLTDSSTSLDAASANASSIASGSGGGYAEVSKGSYRLRITGAGEKSDLRLDVPQITLGDTERVTVIVQPSAGGVLVHALVLVQQGSVVAYKNTSARARVVAGVGGNGSAAVKIGSTSISSAQTSPGVGSYVLFGAGSSTLLTQVGGATVSSATTSFSAGADYTVLVYGTAASPLMTLITDDNRLPSNSAKAKVRLVNAAAGYDTLSLAVDSVSLANDVPLGTASSYASTSANSGNALIEVISALSNDPLYTTAKSSGSTGVSIDAQGVYSVFMLGGNALPRGVLRKER